MASVEVQIKWSGGQGVLRELAKRHRAVVRAVDVGALMVQGEAVRSIQQGPKTGREYVRGKITHQASAPGEAPATDTGVLQASIQPDYILDTQDVKLTHVTARAAYAGFLEEGTTNMDARPFLSKALQKLRKKIIAMIRTAAGGKK